MAEETSTMTSNRKQSAAQRRVAADPTWAKRRAYALSGRLAVSVEDTDHLAARRADEEVV